ncbi:DUF4185 domain-containing protein [Gordonia phthalatica]|uniref:DUF4185 domain-containing protein n=1 Tax=Gordonia phthalatica TaxID=1136941 RepID=A0A0N9N126_9ACTN|nr:DUF4185 domain-containing protein [Gordonia phthalatica]ALG83834.1 hypothetical protein ACH46_04070 [Gordonia phthalatica]
MRRLTSRTAAASTLCTALVALSLSIVGSGPADAAPCGVRNGNGSSLLPFLSTGSLGGLGSSAVDSDGPQGPLPRIDDGTTRAVAWVTGPRSANRTLTRFGISGTDVGAAWDNGSGQTLMAFGDTFGDCRADKGQWRHNVLLRTDDADPSDGLTVADGVAGDSSSGASVSADRPHFAREMIGAAGQEGLEVTSIPTSGIAIDGKQYLNYMSVRKWGPAGSWDTNFSAIAVSSDNGQTWVTVPETLRINVDTTIPTLGDLPPLNAQNAGFQQTAYVAGRREDAGWIYQFGTPSGRSGPARLARFRPADVLQLDRYQYWTGRDWATSIDALADAAAAQVVEAPVSELSVAWSERLGKYLMLQSPRTGLELRTADHPEGPWSAPTTLVHARHGVYAPMMLPQSPALLGTGPELYFNGSLWNDYNVVLMRTTLR